MSFTALTTLQWLRLLLDDNGSPQVEVSNATGQQTEFFAAAPPMSSPSVYVNSVLVDPSQYTVPVTADEVIFNAPPAQNSQVMIRYTREQWADNELSTYLGAAALEYYKPQHQVYRAGIFAIDTLLLGSAVSFDFGSGQENFSFSGPFGRMMQLREMLEQWVENNAEEGILEIVRVNFDSIEPGDMRDDPAGQPWAFSGLFPDSSGGLGGLDP